VLDLEILLLLAGAGMAAGFVDAIAGGGGLIGIPALLAAGVPPVAALATNKIQGIVGTSAAALTYWRRGHVNLRVLVWAIATTLAGSFLGALSVKSIDVSVLTVALPVALICVASYFLFAPRLTDNDRAARLDFARFVPLVGFFLGFYDGIFGPGTGSFFTICLVVLFGLGVTRATASTKTLNWVSNFGALLLFIPSGDVVWPAAIAMAIGQLAGGWLGALTGLRFGARLIKPFVVTVSLALAIKLLFFS
jgi:hypothetical protein